MRERLYRSRHDRVIGGLAAGLGRNLGIDVTWVRLGWVVLAFLTQGAAVLIYIVLLFVIPEEPAGYEAPSAGEAPLDEGDPTAEPASSARPAEEMTPLERLLGSSAGGDGSRNAALIVGVVLVAAGAWLLVRRYVLIDFDLGWPVVAIVLGVVLIFAAMRTGGSRT